MSVFKYTQLPLLVSASSIFKLGRHGYLPMLQDKSTVKKTQLCKFLPKQWVF